ncbi:hypothetical protein GP486_003224 [Trichoglossum hirsutum]|uniref:2-dehydropantoate 2-reductase n=1 Tax=Trichoglossum hirsutum TaxID=265104 RepID=A0A9P8LDG3_9PEZI|nr:hypothetical protein GP486_003224 [Trichoglossum hirsutum]
MIVHGMQTYRRPLVYTLSLPSLFMEPHQPNSNTSSLLRWRSSSVCPAEPIHVLGVGNVGKLVAHSLARVSPAPPVALLLHRPELLSEWEKAGRCIDVVTDGSSDKQRSFTTEMISNDKSDANATSSIIKNLIVTTKTYATSAAIRPLKHRLNHESTILFLQNGMGRTIEEVTSELFPNPSTRPHYLAGITSHGAHKTGPFSIVHAGHGTTTISAVLLHLDTHMANHENSESIFSIPESSRYLVDQLLSAPTLAAMAVTPAELLYVQLEKLIVNAMVNSLTVVFNCLNGQLFNRPSIATLMQLLLSEAAAVVRALILCSSKGDDEVAILESRFSQPILEQLVRTVAAKTGENISSMLQDVRASRETEVDYINGYIVARGMELGVDCVHNRTLVQMVKDKRVISEFQIPDFFPR